MRSSVSFLLTPTVADYSTFGDPEAPANMSYLGGSESEHLAQGIGKGLIQRIGKLLIEK